MRCPRIPVGGGLLAAPIALSLALLLPPRAAATPDASHDPLAPLVRRMDRYFRRHELEGVTLDSRYPVSPSEAIRMSVVCQTLGYSELYRVRPSARFRRAIARHADFMLGRLDTISSHTPFDGMLGYSLLAAYGATGEARFLAAGRTVLDELMAIPTGQCILNGGLMVAMATAEYHRLTGDAAAEQKTRDILAQLPAYQHADGSFPHWCVCSRDIHYTGWMAMELILIERALDDPLIEPMLERMNAFMEGRVDPDGKSRYEEPCPGVPGCMLYYYSRASGCSYDYDTRGWTVEPGYQALLFDHFRSRQYRPVMRFLLALENRGTFPDLYGYWPPPDDPEYVWTIADTSVANMSIIFWSLATALSGRGERGVRELASYDDEAGEDGEDPLATNQLAAVAGDDLRTRPAIAGDGFRADPADAGDGFRAAPAVAAPRARRWSAVDSRFLAGASPAYECDEAPGPGGSNPGILPPRGVRLGPILPNPARAACEVRFSLAAPARVSLAIYDAGGRRVRELVATTLAAGEHSAGWDMSDAAGRAVGSGLYFARLLAGAELRSTRLLVLR
ncbi:MAG: hypothetical protein HZC42_07105 [Candidatus Eisenbacteria bacterium]|nr:hypothetical protein [Candidatus Eisenbacteria bacterium]